MPYRPRRPCGHPGCPRFQPCALHPTSTPYRGSSTAQGYGAAWGKVSERVLAEEPVRPGYERPCGKPTTPCVVVAYAICDSQPPSFHAVSGDRTLQVVLSSRRWRG